MGDASDNPKIGFEPGSTASTAPPAASKAAATGPGGWGDDILARARRTILRIMDGDGDLRNSAARLGAARLVLGQEFLKELSDEDLLAEVRRRTEARRALQPKP